MGFRGFKAKKTITIPEIKSGKKVKINENKTIKKRRNLTPEKKQKNKFTATNSQIIPVNNEQYNKSSVI